MAKKTKTIAPKGQWFVLEESSYWPNKVFIYRIRQSKYKLEKKMGVIAVDRDLDIIRTEAESYYKNRIKSLENNLKEIEEYLPSFGR